MTQEIAINQHHQTFESIRKVDARKNDGWLGICVKSLAIWSTETLNLL